MAFVSNLRSFSRPGHKMPPDRDRTVDQRLRAAVEAAPSGLLMVDVEGHIVLVNREIERLFGYAREELLGRSVDLLVPMAARSAHAGFRAGFLADPSVRTMGAGRDLYGLRKDGSEVPVEIGLTPVVTEEGIFVLGSVVDISQRKASEKEHRLLERQLRQAQKMEAVGTLAGGIAHDFNNILGAIIGYAELLEPEVEADHARVDLSDLLAQAERGRQLVKRLLAFSRRQETVPRPLSLDRALDDIQQLLRATLPATIDIEVEAVKPLPRILADGTAIQQVLMNLGTNAAHAMPRGGKLKIRAEPFYIRDSKARAHAELREGPHVMIEVADTGTGMDEETRNRALEPFFTTKPPGSGSGLGLSMVHGLMQEHEGGLELESAPGSGTVVRIFFPVLSGAEVEEVAPDGPAPPGSGQRILYVDDEESLAYVGRRRLERLGYRVTAVTKVAEAQAAFDREPDAFDVVVTDYSMPGNTGIDLIRSLQEQRPELKAVLLTGFVDALSESELESVEISEVLEKPLSQSELGMAVHRALGAAKPA